MAVQIKGAHLPPPILEYKFNPDRRYRADFCWPAHFLILEIEGATWTQGRHTRGQGVQNDIHKYNSAVLLGYRVLRATGQDVKDGTALTTLEKALAV